MFAVRCVITILNKDCFHQNKPAIKRPNNKALVAVPALRACAQANAAAVMAAGSRGPPSPPATRRYKRHHTPTHGAVQLKGDQHRVPRLAARTPPHATAGD